MANYKGCGGVIKVANELGTGTGYLTAIAAGVGDTAITVDTGTGTILVGNVITFNGDANKYVVVTALAGGVVTIAAPGLVLAVLEDVAITVEANYNIIAEVRDWNLTQTAEILDASAMGSCDKVKKVGMKDSTGSINCLWDDTDAFGQGVLNDSTGNIVELTLYPANVVSGNKFVTLSALITSVGTSSSYDGLVETSYDFEGTGEVVWEVVP